MRIISYIVWKQHGRVDVVLASVVVTPRPGMIMFSLEALLEPPRKPFTEHAEKFVKLEELDGCGMKPTSYQSVPSRAPSVYKMFSIYHCRTRTPAPPRVSAKCRLIGPSSTCRSTRSSCSGLALRIFSQASFWENFGDSVIYCAHTDDQGDCHER